MKTQPRIVETAHAYVDSKGGLRIYMGKRAIGNFPVQMGDSFKVEIFPNDKKLVFTKLE